MVEVFAIRFLSSSAGLVWSIHKRVAYYGFFLYSEKGEAAASCLNI